MGSLPCRTADVERRRTDVVADGAELRDARGDERAIGHTEVDRWVAVFGSAEVENACQD